MKKHSVIVTALLAFILIFTGCDGLEVGTDLDEDVVLPSKFTGETSSVFYTYAGNDGWLVRIDVVDANHNKGSLYLDYNRSSQVYYVKVAWFPGDCVPDSNPYRKGYLSTDRSIILSPESWWLGGDTALGYETISIVAESQLKKLFPSDEDITCCLVGIKKEDSLSFTCPAEKVAQLRVWMSEEH